MSILILLYIAVAIMTYINVSGGERNPGLVTVTKNAACAIVWPVTAIALYMMQLDKRG